jgi:quinoprotein glucose dehydrogenase
MRVTNISMSLKITVAGLAAIALLNGQGGSADRGKQLFQSNGCANCHRVGDSGSRLGPNLTDIGDRREADRLQKAIVTPDDEVLPENRFVEITMKDGSAVKGRLLNHDAFSVQFLDAKEQLRSIQTSQMKGYKILTTSAMPSFQNKLSAQAVNDLVAYLGSLKTAQ